MPIHDWSRVSAGTFHAFHVAWLGHIQEALNTGVLPPDYYAMAEQIAAQGLTRDGARKARKAYIDPTGASEPFVYRYDAPDREFRVEVKFKRANINAEELFEALNAAAQNIDEAM